MVYQKSFRLGFPLYYNMDAKNLGRARVLRKDMTSAEKKL